MEQRDGAFYSAEDADSEGVEGKFYTWRLGELAEILTPDEMTSFIEKYNIRKEGNFTDEAAGRLTGANIPHLAKEDYEGSKGSPLGEINFPSSIREKLFTEREKRIHPLLDDKILTDWNGLAIGALARASLLLDDDEPLAMAERAWKFIAAAMTRDDGTLVKRYRNGEAGLPAHLDDYAFMMRGALELHQATLGVKYLETALAWCDIVLDTFADDDGGGFFFTERETKLAVRRRPMTGPCRRVTA